MYINIFEKAAPSKLKCYRKRPTGILYLKAARN